MPLYHDDYNLVGKTLTTTLPWKMVKQEKNIRHEIVDLLINKFGLDPSSLNRIVWVTDEGSNIIKALEPYRRLSCFDHLINTVLRHGLHANALSENTPDIGETISSVQDIYSELREKLENRGEVERNENIAPDLLSFLVTFLEPFYNSQRELERLKRHCHPSPTDSPQQAFVRQRHADTCSRSHPTLACRGRCCGGSQCNEQYWLHTTSSQAQERLRIC
ncbi:hypothetical protein ABG768_012495 [Culter alburnus]|uniref:Transposase n=1 Tax=Culter alburnus TaxID=194366 RepID=A0AAW2B120_CULAL